MRKKFGALCARVPLGVGREVVRPPLYRPSGCAGGQKRLGKAALTATKPAYATLPSSPMMADIDTLHLHLPHEELKDLLRRRFARAGLEPPILDAIDEIALLVRRLGFPAVLERLKLAVQKLSRPLMPPIPLAEWHRLNEAALADFDARMQMVTPTYQPGDRVTLHGEVFKVYKYQRGSHMTGYWLRRGKDSKT